MSTSMRALLVAVLFSLTAPTPAWSSEGFALRTLEPAPAGDRFFSLPDASVGEGWQPAASLSLDFDDHPLVLRQGEAVVPNGDLVSRQLTLLFGASFALADRARVDLSVPFVASRSGQTPSPGMSEASGSGIEDLRVGVRYALRPGELLALAAGVRFWIPTGDPASFGSDGSVRAEPQLLASGRLGPLVYAADVGLLLRKAQTVVYTEVGSAVTAGASLGLLMLGERLQIGPEVYGRRQFEGTDTSPFEGLLAARWRRGDVVLGGALGTRFGQDAPGASPFKVLLQLTWAAGGRGAQAVARSLAVEPEPAPAAPPRPSEPVAPVVAASEPVVEPAPVAPPPPALSPEPAPAAAVEPAPEATAKPVEVKVTRTRLEIQERILFQPETEVIHPGSIPALDAVAATLAKNPQIVRVVLEGHTDSLGPADYNRALSARRAGMVRSYLVGRGVAAERLEARGFGPDRPIADNGTPAGREKNRRVEFVIGDVAAQ